MPEIKLEKWIEGDIMKVRHIYYDLIYNCPMKLWTKELEEANNHQLLGRLLGMKGVYIYDKLFDKIYYLPYRNDNDRVIHPLSKRERLRRRSYCDVKRNYINKKNLEEYLYVKLYPDSDRAKAYRERKKITERNRKEKMKRKREEEKNKNN
jgi:hypothetical protein